MVGTVSKSLEEDLSVREGLWEDIFLRDRDRDREGGREREQMNFFFNSFKWNNNPNSQ